jgi:large subunit ribosomal protein L5
MLNQHSLEEIADIHNLLGDIKKEYENGIKPILIKNSPKLFKNPHTVPKLKKIQINRGLGAAAQNTNILKKNIEEFEKITGQKPVITKAKKAIAGFKIREEMELGLTVTLRGEKMYTFLTKLLFFTFAQIRDFRGLSLRSFDKSGNYTLGLKEQLIFPEIEYDDVDQIQGFTITIVMDHGSPKYRSESIDKILNGMILFKFLRFPLNDCGYYDKYESFTEINRAWDKKRHLKRNVGHKLKINKLKSIDKEIIVVNDTISDMLTRIRNANMVKHQIVQIPSTKMSLAITKILKEEGYIEDFEQYSENNKNYLLISLKYRKISTTSYL